MENKIIFSLFARICKPNNHFKYFSRRTLNSYWIVNFYWISSLNLICERLRWFFSFYVCFNVGLIFFLFLFTIANCCGNIINNWMKVHVERMEMYYFTIAALIRWQRIRSVFQLTRYVQIAHLLKFAILLPFQPLFFSVGSFIWVWIETYFQIPKRNTKN